MTRIRTTFLAGIGAAALVTAGATVAPSQAQAGGKHFAGALVGGIVAGAIIGAATRPAYAGPGYGVVYQPRCWWDNRFAGHDYYGRPIYQRVQVCG